MNKVEELEMIIEALDTTFELGEDCLNPLTGEIVLDNEYDEFKKTLYSLGETPLPTHIIKRDVNDQDSERYQTIYAKNEGAVAAPTAGMHFSRELLKRLEIIGVNFGYITLHVGLGNFRNVDVEDLTSTKWILRKSL